MRKLNPDAEKGPDTITIKVSHGPNEFEVAVPSNSRFADLKSVIAGRMGLKLEDHKLLFRGKEQEDDDYLETAGVKENSKVVLIKDAPREQEVHEEVKETVVPSKGGEAVAQVKKEVDKLAEQASAFQATLDSGKKVDEKSIVILTEMLMRQLLKLDGIDAEGEGKVQRKMEVHRVQSLVDTMDLLKSKNSAPPTSPAHAPSSSAPPVPSPASDRVQYPEPGSSPPPVPAPEPSPSSPVISPAMPYHNTNPTHSYDSGYVAHSSESHSGYLAHSTDSGQISHSPNSAYFPHSSDSVYVAHSSYAPYYPYNPYAATTYAPAPYPPTPYPPTPYPPLGYESTPYAHNPYASSYYAPYPMPSYNPSSVPPYDPSARPSEDPSSRASSYAPSGMPSSTTVTRDWERFE